MVVGDDELGAMKLAGKQTRQEARKRRLLISPSLVATVQPSTRRLPEASVPTAINTAQSTILPSRRDIYFGQGEMGCLIGAGHHTAVPLPASGQYGIYRTNDTQLCARTKW